MWGSTVLEAVTGLIGGGKSCLAIYRALKYCSEGGRVYMNMRLIGMVETYDIETHKIQIYLPPDAPFCNVLRKRYKWEYQQGQYNFLIPEDMEEGFQSAIPAGTPDKKVLVVIDEVNEWFDTKDRSRINSSDDSYRRTLRFMRQSRKVYIDVIFILQVFGTLDNRIRDLIGFVWQCRDMQYFEVAGLNVGWALKRFFVWQKFYKDMRTPIAKPKWVAKDVSIFKCYDTTELFGDGLGVIPAGQVRTDFSGLGRIQKKVKSMNPLQVAILVICCLSSVATSFFILRGHGAAVGGGGVRVVYVTNTVGVSSGRVQGDRETSRVKWAALSYGRAGDLEWAYADGRMYKPGFRTDEGMVVSVDRYAIRLIADDGGERWIFHKEGNASSLPVSMIGGVK